MDGAWLPGWQLGLIPFFMRTRVIFILAISFLSIYANCQEKPKKRIGILGLDTSHAIEFASMFNGQAAKPEFNGYEVTMAYPWGSRTIEPGYTRVPGFIEKAQKLGIKIAGSIDELLANSDYILLETQDGNLHVEQALAVFKAGKPVFIDKPFAANLADVCLIFELAKKYNVSVFTSSSFRYIEPVELISTGVKGKVLGADCFGPCQEEPSHPTIYWYGIHVVEMLYTIMGTGCTSVSRTHTDESDFIVGKWNDNRIGTFRGMRIGVGPYYHYGGFAYCEKEPVALDKYDGYGYFDLMKEILKFFETGIVPVPHETTIEIYAFMSASSKSMLSNGMPVNISDLINEAKLEASRKLNEIKY